MMFGRFCDGAIDVGDTGSSFKLAEAYKMDSSV